MDAALYFPVLRAKAGEIEALGRLSPRAMSRIRPMLDLAKLASPAKKSLDAHLAETVARIKDSWGIGRPVYLDLSHYPPDVTVGGMAAVEYMFRCARQNRLCAIPVTGPEVDRGPGPNYLNAVARVASIDGRGLALRFRRSDFAARKFAEQLSQTLEVLAINPASIDVYLDLEAIAIVVDETGEERQLLDDVTRAMAEMAKWPFRCVVLAGSSVPEKVGKAYDNKALNVQRVEFRLWRRLVDAFGTTAPEFGDYGIVHPHESDPVKAVRPPARIRLSSAEQFSLCRAKRRDYPTLARVVREEPAFYAVTPSWGHDEILRCAAGYGGDGGPREWVARDTNRHLETTVAAIESYLAATGNLRHRTLSEAEPQPWSQITLPSA